MIDFEPRLIAKIKTPAYSYDGGFIPPYSAEVELNPTYEADQTTHERVALERLKDYFVGQLKEQGYPENRAMEALERGRVVFKWV